MQIENIRELFISRRVADKLWSKHAVSEDEVYEVFENEDEPVKVLRGGQVGENYLTFGRTLAGRYLMVGLYLKPGGKVHVATARDMTTAERRRYERK